MWLKIFLSLKHFLTFSNVNEIQYLYQEFVENENYFNTILFEARKNILENHTWEHRATQVLTEIKDNIYVDVEEMDEKEN